MKNTRFDATPMPRRSALQRFGAGGLVAGLLLRTGAGEAGAQSSLTTAATEAAARRAVSAINQGLASGDATLLNAAFSPDYVNHTPHTSLQSGQSFSPDLAGLAAALGELRALAPDAVIIIDDLVASGDTAAIRFTFRGTLRDDVVANPDLQGRRLSFGGAAFVRVAAGQIVESWDYSEAAEFQGAIALPAPTPTPAPTTPPTTAPTTPGEARDVRDFQEVSLEGIGTLLITQGDTESLTIEAESKVLRRIETEVKNGRLSIRPSRSFNTREPITYYLGVKTLTGIALSGAGRAEAESLSADALEVTVDGSGALTIGDLTATTLDVKLSGSASAQIAGTVNEQTVEAAGSATYLASDLASQRATVTTGGAAQAAIQASESLNANASGASRIQYSGNPDVRQQTSAAASVAPAG